MSSTINIYPTFKYSQPEDYRFSHDSVFLARRVFEDIVNEDFPIHQTLDLCAGCGIIGLDLLFHLQKENEKQIHNLVESPIQDHRQFPHQNPHQVLRHRPIQLPKVMTFLEVQTEYSLHFEKNCESLIKACLELSDNPKLFTELNFVNQSADLLRTTEFQSLYKDHFDLIVCNPPYFDPRSGRLSPSHFKNRCRFFIDSSFEDLMESLMMSLKPGGRAYVLLGDQSPHGQSLSERLDFLIKDLNSRDSWSAPLDWEFRPSIRKNQLVLIQKK